MAYERGTVVKRPDLFADYDHRPYVCLSDDTHPFGDEEALYPTVVGNPAVYGGRGRHAAVTTTRRPSAVPLTDDDFATGRLPRESYVNPWTIVSIRHADIEREEGRLVEETTEQIALEVAGYLGVR